MAVELDRCYWGQELICINLTFRCQSVKLAVSIKPNWKLLVGAKDGKMLYQTYRRSWRLGCSSSLSYCMPRRLGIMLVTGTQIYHVNIQHYHLPNLSIQLNGGATINSWNLFESHLGHCGLFILWHTYESWAHMYASCLYPYCKARCSGCALRPDSRVIGTLMEYTTVFSLSACLAHLSKESRARRKAVHIWISGFCVIQLNNWFNTWEFYTEILLRYFFFFKFLSSPLKGYCFVRKKMKVY